MIVLIELLLEKFTFCNNYDWLGVVEFQLNFQVKLCACRYSYCKQIITLFVCATVFSTHNNYLFI